MEGSTRRHEIPPLAKLPMTEDSSRAPFSDLFTRATGYSAPFPYQERLAQEAWPDALHVPTGLGKTAAVGLAWLHKRLQADPDTPRRLIYCLPMRVLAEQTVEEFRKWLGALGLLGSPGDGGISVSLLMGGEEDVRRADWARHPEEEAVLIGTQDMLLSRALMRGYGMSRYQWPVHFALLHSDALWVFDEVQLMGPALPTSAQLEAFRRRIGTPRPARSLWVSATLHPDWLATVDFRPHLQTLSITAIAEEDREAAGQRLDAEKRLHRADVVLDREGAKSNGKKYLEDLAGFVTKNHVPGTQTLIVLNRVDRAQRLVEALRKESEVPVLLVHARFREEERTLLNRALRNRSGGEDGGSATGRIVVATQAVEAGVDVSSRVLVTELAPWSSLVQRFGRCNRTGEFTEGADIHWIDIEDEADEAAPYLAGDLARARDVISELDSASPGDLPPVDEDLAQGRVLRWKDLVELFDTDPDLSGFDVDVAPYIRDQGSPQVQVFWREFDDSPGSQPAPLRRELCAVSMGQMARFLKKKRSGRTRPVWTWDPLEAQWRRRGRQDRLIPGSTLLLRADVGGYDRELGFDPDHWAPVHTLEPVESASDPDSYADSRESRVGRFIALTDHADRVRAHVRELAEDVDESTEVLSWLDRAALWHDVGKAHPAFQTALLDAAEDGTSPGSGPWAKSPGSGRLRYRMLHDGFEVQRPYFRHELASMLAWLEHGDSDPGADLVAYLIAAHHGKVRMGLRALPAEPVPEDDRLFARGVWDGDELPAMELDERRLPATRLRLDLMQMGLGRMGPSWGERTRSLMEVHGPFTLAWLESLLRIADWRASAEEEGGQET